MLEYISIDAKTVLSSLQRARCSRYHWEDKIWSRKASRSNQSMSLESCQTPKHCWDRILPLWKDIKAFFILCLSDHEVFKLQSNLPGSLTCIFDCEMQFAAGWYCTAASHCWTTLLFLFEPLNWHSHSISTQGVFFPHNANVGVAFFFCPQCMGKLAATVSWKWFFRRYLPSNFFQTLAVTLNVYRQRIRWNMHTDPWAL